MNRPDKGSDMKPLVANSTGVALAVKRTHAIAAAPSDAGSYAPHDKLILSYLDAYWGVWLEPLRFCLGLCIIDT